MSSTVVEDKESITASRKIKGKKTLSKANSKSYYFGSMMDVRSTEKLDIKKKPMTKTASLPTLVADKTKEDNEGDGSNALGAESSFGISVVKGKHNKEDKLKKNRRGKHHVKIEVVDGFVDTNELASDFDTGEDSEDEDYDSRPGSLREPRSGSHAYERGTASVSEIENVKFKRSVSVSTSISHGKKVDNHKKSRSGHFTQSFSRRIARNLDGTPNVLANRNIYYCEVIYDGVLVPGIYGEENMKVAEDVSYRRVVNKSKASTSWKSVHTINVQKTASDVGIRYLVVKVRKKSSNSVLSNADTTIGRFRVPLGGLRQNETVENWYVITNPPGVGKVRLKATYTSTLPLHGVNDNKKKARLLVYPAPHLYEYIPFGKTNQFFTKHYLDIKANNSNNDSKGTESIAKDFPLSHKEDNTHIPFHSKSLPLWPSPVSEVIEEIYDDVCLVGGKPRHDNVRDILVSGALILSSYRLIFMPHRAAFRKGSRNELDADRVSQSKKYHKAGYKEVEHLEIPLGWIMDISLVDAFELGPECPFGTLFEIKCKLPGMYYFHLGAKKLDGIHKNAGCCAPFASRRTIEEVSLEQLTYSPEILLENLVSKMEWLMKEQKSRLFKGDLITKVEESNIGDGIENVRTNPLTWNKQLAKSMFNNSKKIIAKNEERDDHEDDNDNNKNNNNGNDIEGEKVESNINDNNDSNDINVKKEEEESKKEMVEPQTQEEEENEKEGEDTEGVISPDGSLPDDAARLGFRQHGYRQYEQLDFHLCKTYPSTFFVPSSMTSEDIKQVSKYRSKGRIPALVWRHPYTGAVICRCAQPMSGLTSKSSSLDKKMLLAISESSHSEASRRSSSRSIRDRNRVLEVMATFNDGDASDNSSKEKTLGDDNVDGSNSAEDISNSIDSHGKKDNGKDDDKTGLSKDHNDNVESDKSSLSAMTQHSVLAAENDASEMLNIMDMRPLLNVVANKLGGKGTENVSDYSPNFSMSLLNVENIHVMRKSLRKLILHGYQGNWKDGIRESKWLNHTTMLLVAAAHGVRKVQNGVSVLVHCSDGWDRTPQATSLIMLMADPFYRTISGFLYLIQNQWCDFGHKFHTRLHSNANQTGPVFIQFMDCVYQMMQQFPDKFQFTQDLLIFIIDHAFSGWFFTFLTDSEKNRRDAKNESTSRCVFQVIFEIQEYFLNKIYVKSTSRIDVIDVKTSPKDIKLWMRFYGRALHGVRQFSHKIQKPRHVTRLLHRKLMRKMLTTVLNGVRPPTRAKRTSLFLGGHLSISRYRHSANKSDIHANTHKKSMTFKLKRRRNSSVKDRKILEKMPSSNALHEKPLTNQESNTGGKSCVVM
jgi:hypothetical protein